MHAHTHSVRNRLPENQAETLLHEQKGRTPWFREETTGEKKKLFAVLKCY